MIYIFSTLALYLLTTNIFLINEELVVNSIVLGVFVVIYINAAPQIKTMLENYITRKQATESEKTKEKNETENV